MFCHGKQASAAVFVAVGVALAALLCLFAARQQHPSVLIRSFRQQNLPVHPLLQHLLVVVSFNWDVHKLVFLEEVSAQADDTGRLAVLYLPDIG